MGCVLVVNAGSSSLKFQVLSAKAEAPTSIFRGQVDGIGTRPRLRATNAVIGGRSFVRARVAEKLTGLGVDLDPAANEAGATIISRQQSRVTVLVVPTDEELMIAKHTLFAPSPTAAQDKTHRRTA